MLETSSDNFITINNIELEGGGRTDKLPWQILEKWASVPRLLSGIVDPVLCRECEYWWEITHAESQVVFCCSFSSQFQLEIKWKQYILQGCPRKPLECRWNDQFIRSIKFNLLFAPLLSQFSLLQVHGTNFISKRSQQVFSNFLGQSFCHLRI